MNLHIFYDELGIYSKYAIDRIRQMQGDEHNIFVNLVQQMTYPNEKLLVTGSGPQQINDYIATLPQLDKIICHPYNIAAQHFLNLYEANHPLPTIYWCCWSGEIYNLPSNYPKILEPFSLKIFRSIYTPGILKRNKVWGRQWVGKILQKIFTLKNTFKAERRFIRSFGRIDTFFSLQKKDYDYLMKISGHKYPIKHHYFNYISTEKFKNIRHEETAQEIMVGHSCCLEANHYELLTHLKKIGITSKLYMPISYGDDNLAQILAKEANRIFGDQVFAQLKDLPPDEYYQQLGKVGYAIFNVKVQQGLGNILGLVYAGKKVFIREESSIYQDLKQRGAFVFSTNSELTAVQLTTPLTEEQRAVNRDIIGQMISEVKVEEYWQPLTT